MLIQVSFGPSRLPGTERNSALQFAGDALAGKVIAVAQVAKKQSAVVKVSRDGILFYVLLLFGRRNLLERRVFLMVNVSLFIYGYSNMKEGELRKSPFTSTLFTLSVGW